MIKTQTFSLTKPLYTKIILKKRLKKSWWLYALMILFGVLHLSNFGKDNFSTFFVIFAVAYPLGVFIFLWFWTRAKGHQPIFSETSLTFDNRFLYFRQNNNESKLDPNTLQHVVSNAQYWLLYISKGQFIYVPKNIFFSKEDYNNFSNLINIK